MSPLNEQFDISPFIPSSPTTPPTYVELEQSMLPVTERFLIFPSYAHPKTPV